MKNLKIKRGRIFWLIVGMLTILSFFTSTYLISKYYYYLCRTYGSYTEAMKIMDRLHEFNLSSWFLGTMQGSIIILFIIILLDR